MTKSIKGIFRQAALMYIVVASVLPILAAGSSPTGPTLYLDYAPKTSFDNPVEAFMYFVPLTSLTGVRIEIDPATNFSAGVVNWNYEPLRGRQFRLTCDFDVYGQGLYRVVYDPKEMIDFVRSRHPKEKTLTKLLDWIQVDGPCRGQIMALGRSENGRIEIDQITVSFVRDDAKSPVKTCIYDLPPKNKQYDYAHRVNVLVARVNALTFRRSEDWPRMSVQVGSIVSENQAEGWISSLSAFLANFLLPAQPVSAIGNQTMLDFGKTLCEKQSEFVFPAAATIRGAGTHQASAF